MFDVLGQLLKLPSEDKVPFRYLGPVDDFNGVDIIQSKSYVEISCQKYIDRVLKSHGWQTQSKNEQTLAIQSLTTEKPISPIPPDANDKLYHNDGPLEGTPEYKLLSEKFGFKYRTLLGELMFCYVTCRPNIGYAITTLSKFAKQPNDIHYLMLKNVARYLQKTKTWGIWYKRSTPSATLPERKYNLYNSNFIMLV